MNWMKLVCVVVLAAGAATIDCSNAVAQLAGPAAPPKSKSDAEKSANEHSLLKSIAAQPKAEATPTADFCQCIGENSAAVARIKQTLRAPLHSTGLEFQATPLVDVLSQIQSDYGLPIQLDKPALEEAAIAPDTQIDASIHNTSLQAALRLMLNMNSIDLRDPRRISTDNDPRSCGKEPSNLRLRCSKHCRQQRTARTTH